jgi:hypothetical protein
LPPLLPEHNITSAACVLSSPSGGVDGSLHFLPLSSLVQAEKHQDLVLCSPLPPRPIVSFSASQRRFLLKDSASVLSVWKAGREIEGIINEHNKEGKIGSAGATVPIEEMPRNLLKIQIKVRPLPRPPSIRSWRVPHRTAQRHLRARGNPSS